MVLGPLLLVGLTYISCERAELVFTLSFLSPGRIAALLNNLVLLEDVLFVDMVRAAIRLT